MTGWLDRYRVIDLSDERGLLAGQMLAKLGADVIQVEPPGGSTARTVAPLADDGSSFYWSAYAAGKRSITLDIAQPAGGEVLLRLVDEADFLFETAPPGYLDTLGLGFSRLHERNPELIHVSITPFGSDGPKKDYADAELVLWAAGGAMHPHRDTEGPPLRVSVPQAYLHGAADAAGGALVAHFARLETGRGQHVDVSVQQSVTQATLSSIMAAAVGHDGFTLRPATRKGGKSKRADPSDAATRARRTKWVVRDGLLEMHLGMGPTLGDTSNRLFRWMAEEGALPAEFQQWDWQTLPEQLDAGTVTHGDVGAAHRVVAAFLSQRTKAELQEAALERRVMMAPLNDIGDLLASPHLRQRGFFVDVEENGAQRTLPGPFAFGPDGMFAAPAPAPALGEHTDGVLKDLAGLTVAEIDALRAQGVI